MARARCWESRLRRQIPNGDSLRSQVRSRYPTLHQRLSRSGWQRGTPALPSSLFAIRAPQCHRCPRTAGRCEKASRSESAGTERPYDLQASRSDDRTISRCLAPFRRPARGNGEAGRSGNRSSLESVRQRRSVGAVVPRSGMCPRDRQRAGFSAHSSFCSIRLHEAVAWRSGAMTRCSARPESAHFVFDLRLGSSEEGPGHGRGSKELRNLAYSCNLITPNG